MTRRELIDGAPDDGPVGPVDDGQTVGALPAAMSGSEVDWAPLERGLAYPGVDRRGCAWTRFIHRGADGQADR